MEVLIRVVDKGEAEDASKAGDVLAVCPDGWAWSQAERTADEWRIVRASLLASEVDALLSCSPDPAVLRRREYAVDVARLPDPELYVGARTRGIIDVVRETMLAAMVKKP